jgi:hypothetical protein
MVSEPAAKIVYYCSFSTLGRSRSSKLSCIHSTVAALALPQVLVLLGWAIILQVREASKGVVAVNCWASQCPLLPHGQWHIDVPCKQVRLIKCLHLHPTSYSLESCHCLQHADPEYAALSDEAELDEAWGHFETALESDAGDLEVGRASAHAALGCLLTPTVQAHAPAV